MDVIGAVTVVLVEEPRVHGMELPEAGLVQTRKMGKQTKERKTEERKGLERVME